MISGGLLIFEVLIYMIPMVILISAKVMVVYYHNSQTELKVGLVVK